MRGLCISVWRRAGRVALLASLVTLVSHPALAQIDIAGMWQTLPRNQDGSGLSGDSAGVPLSAEGRWRAHSWSPENFDVAEWVCRPHSWDYGLEAGRSRMRVWTEVERDTQRLIAIHGHNDQEEQEMTIWMDGRPHPSVNALHTWSGFSTGEWDGDELVVTTTHVKEGYIRRSGLMRSDQTTVRTRYRRIGQYLQATTIMYDPVYLAEPYVRSAIIWINDPSMWLNPYPCEEATETAVPRGNVPHFLPGFDPNVADRFGTSNEAWLGGAETMYPEYIAKMKTFPPAGTQEREP